jgi:hypothetical protein
MIEPFGLTLNGMTPEPVRAALERNAAAGAAEDG